MGKSMLFLMNGWSSSAGGIQTVNRELILSLARMRTDITCIAIVTAASDAEVEHAFRSNVTLIRGDTLGDWTSVLLSRDLQAIGPTDVLAIVGHSYFSGGAAKSTRDRFYPDALLAHFVHMNPMRVEGIKEHKKDSYIAEREAKLKREVEVARQADLVFCVGPRLYRYMRDQFASRGDNVDRVHRINCGLSSEVQLERVQPVEPTVLCLGRTESLGVKGLDIFGYAAGLLHVAWTTNPLTKSRSVKPKFVVRGAEKDPEALEATLKAFAREVGGSPTILVRPYTTDTDDLTADLRGASAFLMPSREEGFGLVACEALSVGTPIIVSAESGVAELIQEVARETGQAFNSCIIDLVGDAMATARLFCDATLPLLAGDGADNGFYPRLKGYLLPICSWEAGAQCLIETIEGEVRGRPGSVSASDAKVPARQTQQPLSKSMDRSLSDLELILKTERKLILEIEGVVGVSLKHAVVILVERGVKPQVPDEIAGVQVIVREIEEIRLSSASNGHGYELLVDGHRRATVGLFGIDDEGALFAVTVAHAFSHDSVSISIRTGSGIVPVRIERLDRDNDWAVLRMPAGLWTPVNRNLAHPNLGTAVVIGLPEMVLEGIVNTIEMTAGIVGNGDGKRVYEDLFGISTTSDVPLGGSGAVISSNNGEVLGVLVASMVTKEGKRTLLARDVRGVLATHRLRPATIAYSSARSTVGLIITDGGSADAVLGRLVNVRRFTKGNRLYFRGTTTSGVPVICSTLHNGGNINAVIATSTLLTENEINAIFVVGRCGGLKGDQNIGDVVVSSEIVFYDLGAKNDIADHPRPTASGITPSQLKSLAEQIEQGSGGPIAVHVGPIASVSRVTSDLRSVEEMLTIWPKLLAVDMESAGVAQAVGVLGIDVPVVAVRAIVDVPGKNDSIDKIQALDNAADVALAIISRLMPSEPLDFEKLVTEALRKEFPGFAIEKQKVIQNVLGQRYELDALMTSSMVDIIIEIKNPQRVSSLRKVISDAVVQVKRYSEAYRSTLDKPKWIETVIVVPEIGDVYIDTIPVGVGSILVFDQDRRTFINSNRLHDRLTEGYRL